MRSREVTWQIEKVIFQLEGSHRPLPTKLEMMMVYEKKSPPIMVTWHNSCVTNKKKLCLCFYMAHDYQNQQGDDLWCQATVHKVAWFFDHAIIRSLVTNKKRYISNSTSPMDTKPDRVVTYDVRLTLKKSHHS